MKSASKRPPHRLGIAALGVVLITVGASFTDPRAQAHEVVTAAAGRTLRLHLVGFGTPLPTEIDKGPCPQGRTLIAIRSSAGAGVGSATVCVLAIRKSTSRSGLITQIEQAVRGTYSLPGGTIYTRETQIIRFAKDQRHTTATFRGVVRDGTGRFARARGTVTGGGPGVDGKADWTLVIRLR